MYLTNSIRRNQRAYDAVLTREAEQRAQFNSNSASSFSRVKKEVDADDDSDNNSGSNRDSYDGDNGRKNSEFDSAGPSSGFTLQDVRLVEVIPRNKVQQLSASTTPSSSSKFITVEGVEYYIPNNASRAMLTLWHVKEDHASVFYEGSCIIFMSISI
jgi:hypothetical protein